MSRVEPEVDAEVVVVGAGPAGLVLGILLAQRGRSVVVVERWQEPYRLPRAVHFDDEVGRLLQSCGIGDAVRAVSEPAEIYEWRNGAGTTLLRFGRVGAGPSGWPFSSMFCQPELEAVLEQRAAELPTLEVRRGVTVTAMEQLDERVVIGSADGSTLSARYVVGCDGANSTIRDLAGIEMADRGFFYDWLIVDVVLDEPRVFDPVNLQICDPTRPTTMVSGGPGRRRWEFMRMDETLDDLGRVDRAWELLAPWDVHAGNARIERHAVYTFQARVAQDWRDRRVLLAGDAAHLMPPFAGQGMCSGIRDASNLAWKLDHVLAGLASPELLDTYQSERKPGVEFAIDLSIELGKVICVPDVDQAAARDEAMAAAVDGGVSQVPGQPPIEAGLIKSDAPACGEQFPQFTVDGRPFDEVHGAGWRLVTDHADATLDPGLVGWFEALGGSVVATEDSAPDLSQWLATNGLRWVLQRPDFHVVGAASDHAGAEALLAHLRQALTGSAVASAS